VIITISTDDPPLFDTTMNQEIMLLATQFGFDVSAIDEIILNSARYSFLPELQRLQLEREFQDEMAILKLKHLSSV
jgi:adenosine deaminase